LNLISGSYQFIDYWFYYLQASWNFWC